MQEPRDEAVQAAKRGPNNDRPAPRGGTGPFVADFAPGQAVRIYAEDTALKVAAGTTLVFQIHYTSSGKETTDRSKVGMVFAKEKPKTEVMIAALQNANFTLPSGQADVKVDAEMTLNRDTTIWSLRPAVGVSGDLSRRPDRDDSFRAEVRLQLADRVRVQAAVEDAEGHEDSLDGVVRQLRREQVEPGLQGGRALGRSDMAGDAVHRVRVLVRSAGERNRAGTEVIDCVT
jgi:hypothetical protein